MKTSCKFELYWRGAICQIVMGRKLYQLMVSGIVPRPIAFVSTISESGTENLAPFR